jgi:ElaB/YqjD/DUF883 family membrane-anchored ribosome-binding protein
VDSSLVAAVGALAVALTTGVVGVINSTKANQPAKMNAQLAWVKSAQDDAAAARAEAREAKVESAAARAESEQTRQQQELTRQKQVKLQREMDAMQDWVDRVVRARDAYVAEHPLDQIEDSGVIRLMRAINGGPRLSES